MTEEVLNQIISVLVKFPKYWDGKQAILEMRAAGGKNWRQNEWIGWYFQWLCETNLKEVMRIPGYKYGNSEFDGYVEIDWDFKAHSMFSRSGLASNKLAANDMEATLLTVDKHGKTGLIIAHGVAVFDDEDMTFRAWHGELRGGLSKYSLSNLERGANKRVYKAAFDLKRIDLYLLDKEDVLKQGSFQKGMRNSDGSPRREKLLVDLRTVRPIRSVDFD